MKRLASASALLLIMSAVTALDSAPVSAQTCEYWVSPSGNDGNPGTSISPWATLTHAAAVVPDQGCVVLFAPGVYVGGQDIERRFNTPASFRSSIPYRAIFEADSTVIDFDGARNIVFEGFEVRHSGAGATGNIVNIDRKGDTDVWSENVTIRNNVIHDSYDNDLLKVHNGVRFATIEGNVLYNQGPNEQHMDVNSVTDVVVQDNIFFNDFGASGRAKVLDAKHFIVVKDSNGAADGLIGSERVTIRRNVFSGWQGGRDSMIQIGNDGKPYHEAKSTRIVDNLFLGTGPDQAATVLGVAGGSDVVFVHNTVSGDLPALAYAFRVVSKGDNPVSQGIEVHNNIWSDPTGTMGAGVGESSGDFSGGDPASVSGFDLETNLYWNGGAPLPAGDVKSPSDDARAVTADPGLPVPVRAGALPVWNGSLFNGGDSTIRLAFERIVNTYGVPTTQAVLAGDPAWTTATDILGHPRNSGATLGAVSLLGTAGLDTAACPAGSIADAGFGDLGGLSAESADAIDCLAHYLVTTGTAPGVFDPAGVVSRWQMALFLTRSLDVAGVGMPAGLDQGFGDLSGLSPETVLAVNQLAELGVTKGTAPGVFDPAGVVSRWQMALFLVRSLDAAQIEP